ncbi:MAG TPA: sporulation protein YqfC [Firmicutes bacterium]|nr:sporulation protein YqfC [Bacillota bacterium]
MGKEKKKEGFGAKVAEFLELPSEVVLNLPRLILTGDQQLLVENHQGLQVYTCTEISLNTSVGALRVMGEELNIKLITQDQVNIDGRIRKVEWGEREENP